MTPYKFSYFPDGEVDVLDENVTELEFKVEHEKMPPSNIHVLIGKNGVGKTTLLKDMISALEETGRKSWCISNMGRKGICKYSLCFI